MNEHKAIIGKRLYRLRKNKNYPVNYVTDRLGIARSTYNNWEAGNRAPNGEKLVKLADIFDTTVDYITGKTDVEEQKIIDINELKNYKYTDGVNEIPPEKAQALAEVIKSLLSKE